MEELAIISTKQIQKRFKLHGLPIRPDAAEAIISVLKKEPNAGESLEKMIKLFKQKHVNVVDVAVVRQIVIELTQNDDDLTRESTMIVSAFRMPQMRFSISLKKYLLASSLELFQRGDANFSLTRSDENSSKFVSNILNEAKEKTALYRDRLSLIHQRLERNPLFSFSTSTSSFSLSDERTRITPIEALATGGLSAVKEAYTIFGLISRLEEDRYWIEDLSGKIALDLSYVIREKKFGAGLFTDGCIIIAHGHCVNGDELSETMEGVVFQPIQITMPPPEKKTQSEEVYPGISRSFCGLREISKADKEAMEVLESGGNEAFVIISDLYLDKPDLLSAFKTVLKGFDGNPPSMFILMGNFSSLPIGYGGSTADQISGEEYGALFEKLGSLLSLFPSLLASSHFVFIPGPNDCSTTPQPLLPKSTLAKVYCNRLIDRIEEMYKGQYHITFTSNPSRVFFYNQDIVMFRDDLMERFKRNCVVPPSMDSPLAKQMVQTIIDQGHLSPLSSIARPIYPRYDSALRLFPLPSVIILADHYDQFLFKYEDCIVFNPGSFAADFSFVVYLPSQIKAEFSRSFVDASSS